MNTKRLKQFALFLSAAALALVIAEFRLAVFKNDEYSKKAASQRTESIIIKKYRGLFYDRNMIPLVDSSYKIFKVDKTGRLTSGSGEVSVGAYARYGNKNPACHIIGYVDSDGKGVSGLEKNFDSVLDTNKVRTLNVITDVYGNVLKESGSSVSDDGGSLPNSVKLTLDFHIQSIAEKCMDEANMEGAVVVMDVKNSDVLAMASRPSFDRNNVEKHLTSERGELVNRCLSPYNAGSIFKVITLAAALESGTTDDFYVCGGKVNIDGREFNCHLKQGHGTPDLKTAFAKSCNCAFYTMGLKTGAQSIIDMAERFGMGGRLLACNETDENPGYLPRRTSYGRFESVNFSIGQGEILITPLQAANMVCIVANNGVSNSVNIADCITGNKGEGSFLLRSTEEKRVISREIAVEIQNYMRLAVTEGTAYGANDSSVPIAGKTGTAQTGWYENGENMVHGWFCGFFPYDNPKYAMAVIAENGGSGSESAVPIFKRIAEEIMNFYPAG